MKKYFNEMLLVGAFMLIVFKCLIWLDAISFDVFPFMMIFFKIACCYLILAAIFRLKWFSLLLKEYHQTSYYLKSVGWIVYAYIIGYFVYVSADIVSKNIIEKLWNDYPLSEIAICISLVVAWIHKHPRFLVE